MSDVELEMEANKWKIRQYGNSNGSIDRQIIIDALIKKNVANNSNFAIYISIIALLISLLGIFI